MYPDPSTVLPQGADPTNASAKNPSSIFGLSNLPTTLNAQQVQDFQKMTIPSQAPTDLTAQIMGFNQPIQQLESTQKEQETGQTQTQNAILNLMNQLSGQSQFQAQAEEQAGLPALQKGLLDLQNLQRQQTLSYLQGLQNIEGKPIAMEFITGQQEQLNRQRAIDAMATSAQLQAMQGNISLAQDTVKRMVDAKYDPIIRNIQTAQFILEQQGANLSRTDKKLLEAKSAQAEVIKQLKEEETGIQKIGLTLRGYGVDDSVVQGVLNSRSISEAIMKAGNNLQDPRAKLELQKLWGDIKLNEMQRDKEQYNLDLLKRYGSTDPKDIKASGDNLINAKNSYAETQTQMDAIEALKTAPGLSTRVGTSIYSRTPLGVGGAIGKSILPGSSMTADLQAKLSGSGQEFSASIHNLTKGLTLDTLIKAKQNGATFGALSIPELNMLAETATKINDWEIKDDKGNGTGVWNIDEASFVRELDRIQGLYKKALIQSQGKIILPDESSQLDSIFPQSVEPSNYYGI